MQHLANVSELRGAKAHAAAIEVAGLSHVYAGREGQVPALEDIALTVGAGRFVVIEGQAYEFFSMITDIALGATNPEVLDMPPDRDDVLMHAVLAGTSTFGTVFLARSNASGDGVQTSYVPVAG